MKKSYLALGLMSMLLSTACQSNLSQSDSYQAVDTKDDFGIESSAADEIEKFATLTLIASQYPADLSDNSDWQLDDNEDFALNSEHEIRLEDLPWRFSSAGISYDIDQEGNIELGISLGDDDAGADSKSVFPFEDGWFKGVKETPYTFGLNAGDYASGAWSAEMSMTITLHEKVIN